MENSLSISFEILGGTLCFSGCLCMLIECYDFCCTIRLPDEDELYLALREL